jgi:nitroreductase
VQTRIDVSDYPTLPLQQYREFPIEEMRERLEAFYTDMNRRRTVREFSTRPVPRDLIETALKVANTAPSGANLQPWHFAARRQKRRSASSTRTAPRRNGLLRWSRWVPMSASHFPAESTGLATGLLIAALHRAGLATLTHTPSPMKFLNEILGRPKSERPFLLLVVGYPAEAARVPDIRRKSLEEFTSWVDR